MVCRVTEVDDERDLLLFTVLSDDYQDDGDDDGYYHFGDWQWSAVSLKWMMREICFCLLCFLMITKMMGMMMVIITLVAGNVLPCH